MGLTRALARELGDDNIKVNTLIPGLTDSSSNRQNTSNEYPGQAKPGVFDEKRLAALQDFYLKQGIIEKATPVKDLYTNQFVE